MSVKRQECAQKLRYCNILSKQLIPCIWYAACITGQTKEGNWHWQAYGMIKADFALILLLLNLFRYKVQCRQLRKYWVWVFFCFCFFESAHDSCVSMSAWSAEGDMYIIPLYLISPHLYRCLRMSGAISLRWGKMTRFHAGGCAVAAISRPWLRRTAATRTAAPNPRPRSRHDEPATWRPRSRLSQRWLRSSECVPGRKLLLEITRCKDLDFS